MIDNITGCTLSSTATSPSETSTTKPVIDDSFINMLTEKFDNDDIPDPHSDSRGKSIQEMCNISSLLGIEVEGNVITGADLKRSVKQDFNSFQQMLDQALDEAGISKTPAFEITSSYDGSLHISSDHPDKESIEKILSEVPNLQQSYARMSANSALIAACERGQKFNSEYAIDPEAAVDKYRYLFEENSNDIFSIFVSDEGYEPSLQSYGNEVDLNWLFENGDYTDN